MAPRIALYLFDSGTLTADMRTLLGGEPGGSFTVPVPYYLIRHPEGDVLFDGGNALECARDPDGHWGDLARLFRVDMTEDQHVVARLRALGVDPASIRYVIQSHLHMDHTGALGHFPEAKVLVHERELEYARRSDPFRPTGYVRADFERPGIDWQLVDHGEDDPGVDLYGDSSIRTIFTPGHAAGHMSLFVTLPRTGPVLLTADAAYTRAHYDGRALPAVMVSREDTIRSVERLREIQRQTDALVITGHDPDEWERLRRAPEHYR